MTIEEVGCEDFSRGFSGGWLRDIENGPIWQLWVLKRVGFVVRFAERQS